MDRKGLLVLFGLLLPLSAIAAKKDEHQNVVFDPARFEQQRTTIEREMAGEGYREIDKQQRSEVLAALDRMSRLLGSSTSIDALSAAEKVELFNAQEQVNTILTRAAADSRLTCKRETPTGSHRPTTSCMTVAERRRRQEQAQDNLRSTLRGAKLNGE